MKKWQISASHNIGNSFGRSNLFINTSEFKYSHVANKDSIHRGIDICDILFSIMLYTCTDEYVFEIWSLKPSKHRKKTQDTRDNLEANLLGGGL